MRMMTYEDLTLTNESVAARDAHCDMDQQNAFHCFGLFLGMLEKGPETFAVDYEFAARMRPGKEYVCKLKGSYTFSGGMLVGCRNLFGVSWTAFLNEDSLFFINGNLHLCTMLTLRQECLAARILEGSPCSGFLLKVHHI